MTLSLSFLSLLISWLSLVELEAVRIPFLLIEAQAAVGLVVIELALELQVVVQLLSHPLALYPRRITRSPLVRVELLELPLL
jgi:hypothetical protein